MRSLRFGPLARKRREVAAVTGYEDASLGCGQLEHLGIGETLVGRVFGERKHVVLVLAQPQRDAPRREIRIEQQAQTQLCRRRELDERI